MLADIQKDARNRMTKSLDSLRHELAKIRTGRAHPSLLEHVHVDYYGSEVPISQVANISVEDARTLTVTPWEKQMVQVIEKAIMKSDLGLNPATAGTVMRIPMPPLTEESRRNLVNLDVFKSAQILRVEAVPGAGVLPMEVRLRAKDPRQIGF